MTAPKGTYGLVRPSAGATNARRFIVACTTADPVPPQIVVELLDSGGVPVGLLDSSGSPISSVVAAFDSNSGWWVASLCCATAVNNGSLTALHGTFAPSSVAHAYVAPALDLSVTSPTYGTTFANWNAVAVAGHCDASTVDHLDVFVSNTGFLVSTTRGVHPNAMGNWSVPAPLSYSTPNPPGTGNYYLVEVIAYNSAGGEVGRCASDFWRIS